MSGAVPPLKSSPSLLIRGAIWIAIGALVAAASVCVVWVLLGDQGGLIGRAFLTIVLLAAFAGVAVHEAGLARDRPDWFSLLSMLSWIVALLIGAWKIWQPLAQSPSGGEPVISAGSRLFTFLLVIAVLQLALLHVRVFWRSVQRNPTPSTRVIAFFTLGLLGLLVAMLVFFLTFPDIRYPGFYGRLVVAVTILTAVGSALIPLLNALRIPRQSTAIERAFPHTAGFVPLSHTAAERAPEPMYGGHALPTQASPDASTFAPEPPPEFPSPPPAAPGPVPR